MYNNNSRAALAMLSSTVHSHIYTLHMPFQCAFYSFFFNRQKKIYHSQGHNFCEIIIILSEIFTEIGSAYHWQWRLIIYINRVYMCVEYKLHDFEPIISFSLSFYFPLSFSFSLLYFVEREREKKNTYHYVYIYIYELRAQPIHIRNNYMELKIARRVTEQLSVQMHFFSSRSYVLCLVSLSLVLLLLVNNSNTTVCLSSYARSRSLASL